MKLSVVTPLWQNRPPADNLEVASNADCLGYPELWIGEMATYDAFAFATAAGNHTEQIALTIGPLAVSVRTPMSIAMGIASVAALTARTTNVALGASSTVVVEEWHGQPRLRTARHLDETAQIVRGLLAGDKVNFEGEMASSRGYHLRLDPPSTSITIAAFGPGAVSAAARRADRMLLNMVTPASLGRLRNQLDQEALKAGRKTMPSLAVWLTCAVDPEPGAIEQMLHALVGYLSAPGYSEMITEAGFGDLVEFACSRPHPKEILAAMPDELISAIGLAGNIDTIGQRLQAYSDAGADEICLVPATSGDPGGLRTLEAMRQFVEVSESS